MTQHKARRANKIEFLQLPVTQEVSGSVAFASFYGHRVVDNLAVEITRNYLCSDFANIGRYRRGLDPFVSHGPRD